MFCQSNSMEVNKKKDIKKNAEKQPFENINLKNLDQKK